MSEPPAPTGPRGPKDVVALTLGVLIAGASVTGIMLANGVLSIEAIAAVVATLLATVAGFIAHWQRR